MVDSLQHWSMSHVLNHIKTRKDNNLIYFLQLLYILSVRACTHKHNVKHTVLITKSQHSQLDSTNKDRRAARASERQAVGQLQ